MKPMRVMYVRHNLGVEASILRDLYDGHLVALDFSGQSTNPSSTDPSDYSGEGRRAMQRLKDCGVNGALVAAYFRALHPDTLLVGRVEQGALVELFHRTSTTRGPLVYKTLHLADARPIKFSECPVLLATQPQRATITSWPSGESIVNSVYYRQPLPEVVTSLSCGQLEVLAFHYMEARGWIQGLLAPIGRTLIDIDIAGVTSDGRRVFAQVTFAKGKKLEAKARRLEEWLRGCPGQDTQGYLFAPEPPANLHPSVTFKSVTDAFTELLKHPAFGTVVKGMLELPHRISTA